MTDLAYRGRHMESAGSRVLGWSTAGGHRCLQDVRRSRLPGRERAIHGARSVTLPSDEAIMSAVRDGHLELLGVLFRRYQERVFHICYRMVRDRALADDLVQDVFLRILRYRESFRPTSSFGAWLYPITRNVCLDKIKSRSREHDALRVLDGDDIDGGFDCGDDERVALVRAALTRLAPEQREVLLSRVARGLSYAEIARRNGTTAGAERVRAHRALKQLRAIVQSIEDDTDEV